MVLHDSEFVLGRFAGSAVIGPIVRSSVWLRRWDTAGGPVLYFAVVQNETGFENKTNSQEMTLISCGSVLLFAVNKVLIVLVVPAGNPKDGDTADENLNGARFSDVWPSKRFV